MLGLVSAPSLIAPQELCGGCSPSPRKLRNVGSGWLALPGCCWRHPQPRLQSQQKQCPITASRLRFLNRRGSDNCRLRAENPPNVNKNDYEATNDGDWE